MTYLWQDFRYALRRLRSAPGFSTIAIATLALGIGTNTAIFTVVDAILLRPAPVREPERLFTLYTSDYSGPRYGTSSYPDFRDFQSGASSVLDGLAAAASPQPVTLRGGDDSQVLFAEVVSGNYFSVLGLEPVRGRFFAPEEDRAPGTHPVVVLGEAFWRQHFGAEESVIGRTVTVNGYPYTVIGVAPASYSGALRFLRIDLWLPAMMEARLDGRDSLSERGARKWMLIGRLRAEASLEQAQARFNVVAANLHKAWPDNWTDVLAQPRRISVVSEFGSRVPPEVRTPVVGFMGMLLIVVGLVLLIACANLANLLLAKASARRREIAVRLAMGAARSRLVRQMLTENLLLAVVGGAAGVLVSIWVADLLRLFQPPLPVPVKLNLDFSADPLVFAYAFALSLATGLAMGLAPALASTRGDLLPALKDNAGVLAGPLRRFSLRNVLVVVQTTASVVLLIAAGLFIRSLNRASSVSLGFDPSNLVLLRTDLQLAGYDEARGRALLDEIRTKVEALPGVKSAVWAENTALGLEAEQRTLFDIEGYKRQRGEDGEYHVNRVGPGYFRMLGVRMVRGREFAEQDGNRPLAVVNETFARAFFPGGDALGKRLTRGNTAYEVVGVAADARYVSLSGPMKPMVFLPLAQSYTSSVALHARTLVSPAGLAPAIRREVGTWGPRCP